jgi:hypothetical protein
MRILALLVAITCNLYIAATVTAQSKPITEYEDLDKTMIIVESAFKSGDVQTLLEVSMPRFARSSFLETLARAVERRRQLNTAYSGQIAEQIFNVQPGGRRLRLTFILRGDLWLVENSEELDSNGDVKTLPRRGFSALAREYGFSDFRRAADSGKLWQYSGVAPYGRLPGATLKGKRLVPETTTAVVVTNLIIHDGKAIDDLYYLRFEKVVEPVDGRRGWLIAGGGTMLDYELRRRSDTPLLQFLSGKYEALDLSKASAFSFTNARDSAENAITIPRPFEGYRIRSVTVGEFEFDRSMVRFVVRIRCEGASWQPPLTVTLQGGEVVLATNSDVHFVSTSPRHASLDVRVDDAGNLRLARRANAKAPFAAFDDAVIGKWTISGRNNGVDFVVPLQVPRAPNE